MPANTLELSREEMRAAGYRVIDLLVDHYADIGGRRVGSKGDPESLRARFSGPPPETGAAFEVVLAELERDVFPQIMNLIHPRFFAFVPGPSNFVSVLGDTLAAGYNVFNGSWLGGSAAAALELNVLDWVRGWCGLPDSAGGLFVSGGSMANLTALAAARHARLNDRADGAVVYFSDQTHSSVERALRVLGFQPDQMRKIPSDEGFRLPLDALRARVEADRLAGLRPFAVIANAGTTSTGAVDPLSGIAAFCREAGLWFHIDGAYGAASVISDRGRLELDGLGEADSLSLDPHKWLFQTIECGCVLLRDAAILRSAFRITAEYLKDVHRRTEEVNPCDYGVQLTRGFRALKLWMSIRVFGLAAFRAAVERGFELAEFAESRLKTMPEWEIVTPAQMAVVTFRARHGDEVHQRIVDGMIAEGEAFVTSTVLRGRTVLRLCTINPRTSEADLLRTLDRLETTRKSLTSA